VILKPVMRRFLAGGVIAAAMAAGACSGDNTATSPTTTTPAATITPATTVYQIGQTQTLTLTAQTTPTNVVWSSSNPNVITIDGDGNFTAVGVGAATITATADANVSATLSLQVVPIYQGTWIGTAKVLACTDLAGFLANGYCAKNLGAVNAVTLSMIQGGAGVSGTITKSEGANLLNGTLQGPIGAGGDITLTGTLAGLANGSNLQLSVISWNSLADGANMTGTWSGNITSPQIVGIATLQWSLSLRLQP
jgi:hypothetical protein